MDIEKEEWVNMVKGVVPYYHVMDHPLIKRCGHYIGGFHDKWEWHEYELKKLSEDDLVTVYTTCKNSWKKENKPPIKEAEPYKGGTVQFEHNGQMFWMHYDAWKQLNDWYKSKGG